MAPPIRGVVQRMAPIVVILGATATGKSKLAMEIASRFNGEIISADSMQIYKGLDIVTNKVTIEERKLCRHHLIDCVSPLVSTYTVTDFRDKVLPLIAELHGEKKLPIIVGGTNYYIESLLWKFTLDTEVAPKIPKLAHSKLNPNEEDRNLIAEEKNTGEASNANISQDVLYQRLMAVDPESATRIHPNDRRKIARALEIYEQTGQTKSRHLQEQQNSSDVGSFGGPLRYPDVCMLWVKCDQKVLDERIDKRVDDMLKQGLLPELDDFHKCYNSQRISDAEIADYTHGIFQSIGFKEFHNYLLKSEEKRCSDEGKQLLAEGISAMKAATRRYARRQLKWIINRFIKRQGSDVPRIYAVNSTDIEHWEKNVTAPAIGVVSAFLEKEDPLIEPLPFEANTNGPMFKHCDDCGIVFVSKANWEAHISSRRHKKRVESKRRLEKFRADLHSQKKGLLPEKDSSFTSDQLLTTELQTDDEECQNSSVTV